MGCSTALIKLLSIYLKLRAEQIKKQQKKLFLPRLGLLNLSGLEPPPSGEWTASRPAGGSLDEASESAPSLSALHWSSYIRSDGMVSCFLSMIFILTIHYDLLRFGTLQTTPWQHHAETHTHRCRCTTHLFSLLPFPVSLNPLAKGLLSIFNCVICQKKYV